MLWMSRYSSTLLIHTMHCHSSPLYSGNSTFTRIWHPCVYALEDDMLNRGFGYSRVLGEFGCKSFEICNLSKMAVKTTWFFFWSSCRVRKLFSIHDVNCVHFDVKLSLVCLIFSWSSSWFLLIFSLIWSNRVSIDLVIAGIFSTLNVDLFLFSVQC